MQSIKLSTILLFCFLIFTQTVFAAMSLTLSGSPDNLNYDQEFETSVNLNNAPYNTTYYLRIAFTAQGKTAYFGYTQKNDGVWHKYEEEFNNFYQITTNEEGSWSGKIKGRPDSQDNDFAGSGIYILKIGRFTASGKSHSWSDNNLSVNILAPAFTPTPTLASEALSSTPIVTTSPRSTISLQLSPTLTLPNGSPILRQIKSTDNYGGDQGNFDYLDKILSTATESAQATASASPTATPSAQLRSMMSKLFLFLGVLSLIAMVASTVYVDRKKIKQEKLQKKIPTEKTTNKV